MSAEEEDHAESVEVNFPPEDTILTLWVGVANAGAGSVSVTLTVGGTIITGNIVGLAEYFDGIGAELDEASSDAELGKIFHKFAEETRAEVVANEESDEPGPVPRFIHLKDAKIYVAGQLIPSNRGVWWRGRLASVDGWSFGILERTE